MGDETPSDASGQQQGEKAWHSSIAEDLQRTTDSAIQSARSIHHNSSTHLQSLQGYIPYLRSQYNVVEDAFLKKVKDELISAKEHPVAAGGVAVATILLLMRGPRRFLFRHTIGRLQSEEAQFMRAEKNVKELNLSVDLMKKESSKLLERAALAEKEMKHGHQQLMNAGSQVQSVASSVYKAEAKAADLMDGLREISGRDALKLRAEVASMAAVLKQQRVALDKRIMKISELGIRV